MLLFEKKSILYQNMCYNGGIRGALMSPEISKVPKDPLFCAPGILRPLQTPVVFAPPSLHHAPFGLELRPPRLAMVSFLN